MRFCLGKRLGDTLVEVAIAIGIFSLVAIAVVSVVSNSSSSAQANLETTVAREEIDAQAEAIRFIHDAYATSTSEVDENASTSNKDAYGTIWKEIEKLAVTSEADIKEVEKYEPTTCDQPFGDNYKDKVFVINYHDLDTLNASNIIKKGYNSASTYPRIVYKHSSDSLTGDDQLAINDYSRAEGIYVIAVKDPNSTTTSEGSNTTTDSLYYDFYIRTCWYATNANTPSTISTVIRVTDPTPDDREGTRGFDSGVQVVYNRTTDGKKNNPDNDKWEPGKTGVLLTSSPFSRTDNTRGWHFIGWCDKKVNLPSPLPTPVDKAENGTKTSCSGTTYGDTKSWSFTPNPSLYDQTYDFYEILQQNPAFGVYYDANKDNGGKCNTRNNKTYCQEHSNDNDSVNGGEYFNKTIRSSSLFKGADNTYSFVGWCTAKVGLILSNADVKKECTKKNADYYKGGENSLINPSPTPTEGGRLTLYAMWKQTYTIVEYHLGDSNKATARNGSPKEDKILKEGIMTNVHTIKGPSAFGYSAKNCYKFTGWKASNGKTYKGDGTEMVMLSDYEKLTLTAQWDVNCYTVEYRANFTGANPEAEGHANILYSTGHKVEDNCTKNSSGKDVCKFTRSGYAFTGWKNASGTDIRVGSTVKASQPGGTYVLYAQWKKAECDVVDQHFGEIANDNVVWQYNYTKQKNELKDKGTSDWRFPGRVYEWTVPEGCGGRYRLQVWGARGGTEVHAGGGRAPGENGFGGAGGYAMGYTNLEDGDKIYIAIGGGGTDSAGGWNGGGNGVWGGGGGATHIATVKRGNGELSKYNNNASGEILIVAGGGGGGSTNGENLESCPGQNNNIDRQGKQVGVTHLAKDQSYAYGGKGGGGEGATNGNGRKGNNPNTNAGAGVDGERKYCVDNKLFYAAEGSNQHWGETYNDGAQGVYNCAEAIAYDALGGQANQGGRGGWGTDHYSPSISDGEDSGKLLWGYEGDGSTNTGGRFNTEGTDGWHSSTNWRYNGRNPYSHQNNVSGQGSFGQGGQGFYTFYPNGSCNGCNGWSICSGSDVIRRGWQQANNSMGHCNVNEYNDEFTKDPLTKARTTTEALQARYKYILAAFGVSFDEMFKVNGRYAGSLLHSNNGSAGGGGGYYGGGAGATSGCRAGSGAGGSSYTGGVTSPSWNYVGAEAAPENRYKPGETKVYGSAVIRKCAADNSNCK